MCAQRLCVLVVLALAFLPSSFAGGWETGERDAYQKSCEVAARNGGDCAVTARRQHVVLYSLPSVDSRVAGEFPFWFWMALDWRESGPEGWLRVKSIFDSASPNDWVWVRRDDVLNGADYRQVLDCWPIKEVYSGLGDTTYQYSLNRKGRGLRSIDDVSSERIQVFMAGIDEDYPVVTWWGRGGMWARYDPKKRALLADPVTEEVNGESFTRFRQFTPEELQGCGPLPITN